MSDIVEELKEAQGVCGPIFDDLPQRAADRIATLEHFAAFAASCIKSGEPWTDECERMYQEVMAGRMKR